MKLDRASLAAVVQPWRRATGDAEVTIDTVVEFVSLDEEWRPR